MCCRQLLLVHGIVAVADMEKLSMETPLSLPVTSVVIQLILKVVLFAIDKPVKFILFGVVAPAVPEATPAKSKALIDVFAVVPKPVAVQSHPLVFAKVYCL